MELIKRNPIRDVLSLRCRMNHVFDDLFYPAQKDAKAESIGYWRPSVDVYENDDSIVLKAELPGVDKNNIVVDVKGRFLTLRGERSSENEIKENKYHRRESVYGKFERVFTLPAEVDPEKIAAEYKDGVLKIDIPKPETHQPKKITVN